MNIEQLRDSFRSFLSTYLEEPVAGFLSKIRLNPNHITFLGIFFGLGAGVFALYGKFLFAGIMIFVNGFLDLMDGALARKLNIGVNAGHDLDLQNLAFFLEKVPADEVSIGHALISDSLVMGIEKTVKKYLDLCN